MTAFKQLLPATHHDLSACRRDIAGWLTELLSDMRPNLIPDVELVLTELVANAIDHTTTSTIDVEVAHAGDSISVVVGNEGSSAGIPAVTTWGDLVEGDRGRGLRLVKALCAEVSVVGDDERAEVHATIHL